MTYTVVITERAARAMEDSADRWARERSVDQAEHWYLGIRRAIGTLDEAPERHPFAAEHADSAIK
jgi:plasmid stabilization system protein ParE